MDRIEEVKLDLEQKLYELVTLVGSSEAWDFAKTVITDADEELKEEESEA